MTSPDEILTIAILLARAADLIRSNGPQTRTISIPAASIRPIAGLFPNEKGVEVLIGNVKLVFVTK